MSNNIDVRILDWNGYEFNDSYVFSFCNKNVSYVPQVLIDGKNQLQRDDLWIRYYLFNSSKTDIVAIVSVGPDIESTPADQRVGPFGLTQSAEDILGLVNVYDFENGRKNIGYEIFLENPNIISPTTGDYPERLYGNIPHSVPSGSYPDGWLDTPISIMGGDGLYMVAVNPASPTISFIGNLEEAEFDPENPQISYYASGYELLYSHDYMDVFKTAMKNHAIGLIIKDSSGHPYMPMVSGNLPGEYVSNIKPTDLEIGQGDNPREDRNLWRNFDPIFKISRQIKLIINAKDNGQAEMSIPISASKYYDGKVWAPEVKVPSGAMVRYSIDDGINWSSVPASIENVGTIYVTVEITGLPEQSNALYYYYYLQILPRPIYISSDSKSWNYTGNLNTCDWINIQGHYNETEYSGRIVTRFTPPDVDNKGSVEERIIKGIPLVKTGDTINITFRGGQTEIGSSGNAFDYEIKSERPNNYDVRIEFGVLKVNLNTEDLYVFIRGNTVGTWKTPGDPNILWDNDLEPEEYRSCVYDGGVKSASGWRVVAVTDMISGQVPDPYDPHHNILIPDLSPEHDKSDIYNIKDIEFVGKESSAEVFGVYINNINDQEADNFWTPIEYRSNLSESNFKNTNSNFSNNHIHFIVTPNRLLISKRPTNIDIFGHSQDFTFNMVKDNDVYIPEERSISGYDVVADTNIYDNNDTIYLEVIPGQKIKNTPSIRACCWNEEDENGRWYMGLGPDEKNAVHDGLSDLLEPFESGFINTNKNFEVFYHLGKDEYGNDLDGYICIHPIDVSVSIRGTKSESIYNGEEIELRGVFDHPEIWWKSNCEFFNYPAILEAISKDRPADRWILEIEEEIEVDRYSVGIIENTSKSESKNTVKNPDSIFVKTNYYRAIHGGGYFKWPNTESGNGYASGIEINDLTDPEDPNYWKSVPYLFNININDFENDPDGIFPNTEFHISKNFNITFELIEDGSLTILPYDQDVKVSIKGNSDTREYSSSVITVSGYEYRISDIPFYYPDNPNYMDGPEDPEVSGIDPGSYLMGLTVNEFKNINKNFTNVSFLITDGWLLITSSESEQELTGDTNIYKVFDNTGFDINDITVTGEVTRRAMVSPGYTPAEIGKKIDDTHVVEWLSPTPLYDVGEVYFKIESSERDSDIDIPGIVKTETLRLEISSKSNAWVYDGSSHDYRELNIHVLNDNPTNMSDILEFAESIPITGWAEITEVGTISNSFTIGDVSEIFNPNVSNRIYVINGKLYQDGIIIGEWDDSVKQSIMPNVIITTTFGTLTISDNLNITIKGNQKSIVYDGYEHSLTGYETYLNGEIIDLHIALKHSFQYTESIDKRDAREGSPYIMGLNIDAFDWPEGVTGTVEDGWLEIKKRDLIFKTGSDTGYWNDEEPRHIARNSNYYTNGLADTDQILIVGDWKTQSEPGEVDNNITYEIRHRSGDNVVNNYNRREIWGVLKINKSSEAPMYYRIMGIRKNPTNTDTNKVHINGLKSIDYFSKIEIDPNIMMKLGDRVVDEDRFYPILHKLIPIPEDGVVDFNDVICVLPLFKHSKKIEEATWLFENKSTGEKIFSKVHDRPIFPDGVYGGRVPDYKNHGGLADTPVLNIIPRELKPGYYDVTINYKMDHKEYSQKFSSVFMIRKKA